MILFNYFFNLLFHLPVSNMLKYNFFLIFILSRIELHSQNLDIRILDAINSPQSLPSDKFFKVISNTSNSLCIGVPAGMAFTSIVKHDNELFKETCVYSVALILNFGVTSALKYSINRKRPYESYPFIKKKSSGESPSFPSGHSSDAFTTATSISILYPKWYVIVPSYIWAGTVAYSRMHLGVHYPSDVLGGIIIGIGTSYITFKAQKWLYSKNIK